MTDKYCVGCAHMWSVPPIPFFSRQCVRPISGVPDPVSGDSPRLFRSCASERKRAWFRDTCGPDAKYWEAKPEKEETAPTPPKRRFTMIKDGIAR